MLHMNNMPMKSTSCWTNTIGKTEKTLPYVPHLFHLICCHFRSPSVFRCCKSVIVLLWKPLLVFLQLISYHFLMRQWVCHKWRRPFSLVMQVMYLPTLVRTWQPDQHFPFLFAGCLLQVWWRMDCNCTLKVKLKNKGAQKGCFLEKCPRRTTFGSPKALYDSLITILNGCL